MNNNGYKKLLSVFVILIILVVAWALITHINYTKEKEKNNTSHSSSYSSAMPSSSSYSNSAPSNNSYSSSSSSNSSSKKEKHICEECNNEATHSMIGIFSGDIEYYCDKHYNEIQELMDYLFDN